MELVFESIDVHNLEGMYYMSNLHGEDSLIPAKTISAQAAEGSDESNGNCMSKLHGQESSKRT